MQLRVARLCLDCEELHQDDSCPRCASESYAFLSSWLHTEERRKWRRPAASGGQGAGGVVETINRWFKRETPAAQKGPTTRASDHVAAFSFFDEPKKPQPKARLPVNELSKNESK
jgi:hypothetical protein